LSVIALMAPAAWPCYEQPPVTEFLNPGLKFQTGVFFVPPAPGREIVTCLVRYR
jgi:hypothetical protein